MPLTRPPDAVAFDFDGTLATLNISFAGMRSAIVALMEDFSLPPGNYSHLHILEMIVAGTSRLSRRSATEANTFCTSAHGIIQKMEIAAAAEGRLFPETRPLLLELARRNIRTAVITRNCRAAVLTLFPDITGCTDVFLSREDTPLVKPHPDHLLRACRLMGVAPLCTVMIGDHPLDMQLACRAGATALGVLSGAADAAALQNAGAAMVAHHLAELRPMLLREGRPHSFLDRLGFPV